MNGYADISPVWLQDELHTIADALTESGIRRWLHAQQSHRQRVSASADAAVNDADDRHSELDADDFGIPSVVWLHIAILAVAAVIWLAELMVGNGWWVFGRCENRIVTVC